MNAWFERSYARLLIDNHITEDDPNSMTLFDPRVYVSMVKKAGVDAAMVYACDHNGNCYYPSAVGHMHAHLNGRDIFGETVSLLRETGVTPVAYYTTVYHNRSAQEHPDWRMQDAAGQQHQGRYWFSCVNNPDYLAFTQAQIAEVIAYPVEGIFIDMTFWPLVCHCASCRDKFRAESGQEIPPQVDWRDPAWVAFQGFRERSMAAFTQALAEFIRLRKDITVTFQNSPIIMGWALGQSQAIADVCDYASGDFYGGKYQHILGAKILSAASRRVPFEYMTSRCINLNDHTSMKSEATLTCEAAATLASGGAYFFIDAIHPDGSLNAAVYARLGKVSQQLAPFAQLLQAERPVLDAEVGLYFSMDAQVDPRLNGTTLRQLAGSFEYQLNPSYDEMLGTSIALTRAHIPFRAVRPGDSLEGLKVLVLNNVLRMSAREVDEVRSFVRSGGLLLATGLTSLDSLEGTGSGDFGLADVMGVTYTGQLSRRVNYLAFPNRDDLVSCNRPAALVHSVGAQVLAELEEPLFDPDEERYVSIHSNPPGRKTGCAAFAVHTFGRGSCIYLASAVLASQQEAQQEFAEHLLHRYFPLQVKETSAPPCVEVTLLKSSQSSTRIVGLVNWQKEQPNVPVRDLRLTLNLDGFGPRRAYRASTREPLPFLYEDRLIEFTLPDLNILEMVVLESD
jgi:hypothetical protein